MNWVPGQARRLHVNLYHGFPSVSDHGSRVGPLSKYMVHMGAHYRKVYNVTKPFFTQIIPWSAVSRILCCTWRISTNWPMKGPRSFPIVHPQSKYPVFCRFGNSSWLGSSVGSSLFRDTRHFQSLGFCKLMNWSHVVPFSLKISKGHDSALGHGRKILGQKWSFSFLDSARDDVVHTASRLPLLYV